MKKLFIFIVLSLALNTNLFSSNPQTYQEFKRIMLNELLTHRCTDEYFNLAKRVARLVFRECSVLGDDFEFSVLGCYYNPNHNRLSVMFTISWTGGLSGTNYIMECLADIEGINQKKVTVMVPYYQGPTTCLLNWDNSMVLPDGTVIYSKSMGYIN